MLRVLVRQERRPGGQSTVDYGTAYAAYVWNEPGEQTISVTVSNSGGTANDSHMITIIAGDWFVYLPLTIREK